MQISQLSRNFMIILNFYLTIVIHYLMLILYIKIPNVFIYTSIHKQEANQ